MGLKTVLNLDADTGANIIGNEATPVLEISNSGAGEALKVDQITLAPGALAANATVGLTKLDANSTASGAQIAFADLSLVSCSTIQFITGGAAGTMALRIVTSDGTFRWIPVLPDAAVTGIAL